MRRLQAAAAGLALVLAGTAAHAQATQAGAWALWTSANPSEGPPELSAVTPAKDAPGVTFEARCKDGRLTVSLLGVRPSASDGPAAVEIQLGGGAAATLEMHATARSLAVRDDPAWDLLRRLAAAEAEDRAPLRLSWRDAAGARTASFAIEGAGEAAAQLGAGCGRD